MVETSTREYLMAIRSIVGNGNESTYWYPKDELLEFIDFKIAQLDKKAEYVKRKRKFEALNDTLREDILEVMSHTFQSREEIFAKLYGTNLSVSKIGARLNTLVDEGIVIKGKEIIGGKRKVVYKLK